MYSALKAPEKVYEPSFWHRVTRSIHIDGAKKLGGTLLNGAEHTEFLTSVGQLAIKAGIWDLKSTPPKGYLPHVLVMDELPIGAMWTRKMPNAGANPLLRGILISKSMMELTGSNIYRKMSPELETIMAHEFSHLKYDGLKTLAIHRGTFALPIVAMAGLYLYDKAQAKTKLKEGQTKQEYLSELTENIHKSADEQIAKDKNPEKPNKWHLDPDWQESIINAGRYGMVAAVALCGGLVAARYTSLAAEYRADKFAVKLTGNPEL